MRFFIKIFSVIVCAFLVASCATNRVGVDVLQSELDKSNERVRELEERQLSALAVVERADERFSEIARISRAEGSTLGAIIERQQRIEAIVGELWADYTALKEQLGECNDCGSRDGREITDGGRVECGASNANDRAGSEDKAEK